MVRLTDNERAMLELLVETPRSPLFLPCTWPMRGGFPEQGLGSPRR